MSPAISVIIVNWNGRVHLSTCLDSLSAQTFRDFEVILVDNGSDDGSLAFVGERYPWVRTVALGENTGFATGNNRGLEHSRGDYIVTLNNDTRVAPDCLETLNRVAEAHPRAGMVGCRICAYSDPDLIDSIGVAICVDGMSRGQYRNRRWSGLRLGDVEEILVPSACAALYRRAMIEQTGFFDDDFFAYAEDVDLGLRGRLAGWEAVAATGAVVYHKYSQTAGSLSPLKVYLVERNHYWVVWKSFPWRHLAAVPFFTLWRYFEQVGVVLRGRGTGADFRNGRSGATLVKALARAIWDACRGLPRVYRKRRQVMKGRRLPFGELVRLMRRHRLTFKELLDCG